MYIRSLIFLAIDFFQISKYILLINNKNQSDFIFNNLLVKDYTKL